MTDLRIDSRRISTPDGWELELKQTYSPENLAPDSLPVLFIPGYGMNNFILGFHPAGTSLEGSLARAGYEVWSVNMRGQGGARPKTKSAPGPSISGFIDHDVPTAIAAVLAHTRTGFKRVVLAGCSLGGTVVYAYAGLERDPRVAALVTIGGPLRWDKVHPVLKLVYASPRLVGSLQLKGARYMARYLLPVAARVPGALNLYMNTKQIDLTAARAMTETVDDLFPGVNKEIAEWMKSRDLVHRGRNVSEAVSKLDLPLLIVLANRDGIVPRETALAAREVWGGSVVQVLEVGDERAWYAHADLFISHRAPETVFTPMARWLDKHGRSNKVQPRTSGS